MAPYNPKIKVSILPEQNTKDDWLYVKGNSLFASILEKHAWRPLFDPWDYTAEKDRIDIHKMSSDLHMSIVPCAYTSRIIIKTNKQTNKHAFSFTKTPAGYLKNLKQKQK